MAVAPSSAFTGTRNLLVSQPDNPFKQKQQLPATKVPHAKHLLHTNVRVEQSLFSGQPRKRFSVRSKAAEGATPAKRNSILCNDCDGNAHNNIRISLHATISVVKRLLDYMLDLDDVIGKINGLLSNRTTQDSSKGAEMFGQDDLEPLGLGPKARAYLLLLVRMNRLTLEHQAGVTMYRLNSK